MFGRLQKLLLTTALVPLGLAPAAANPLGGQVVGGSATVQGQGTATVTVTQQTNSAIINWNTFNIGAGEKTNITMPSASSVQLDRVTGGLGPSQILGSLWSNGRVFLVNPDGILFGSGAKVDTAGFLATTSDIKNNDFMAGRYNFSVPGNPSASIVNQGTITAQTGGFAALVAPGVRNSGTITATLGTVALASGNGFTLDFYGDKLITLGLNDSIAATVKDVATGQSLGTLVKNEGTLKANGGRVELTAASARQVVDSVINNTGVIEANSIGTHNGMIVLGAATAATKPAGAPTQTVKVSGTLSAAGKKKGTTGGTVVVTGKNIVVSGATIDASGVAGGGTVLIGGDVGGVNPNPAVASIPQAQLQHYAVPTASTTTVDAATTINASATDTGNGGKVIVWADLATVFDGTIFARGGANLGNGGFVETSGHVLNFAGARVDTSALYGRIGQWLLDPATLIIDASLANTVSHNLAVTSVTLSADIDLYLTANITKSSGLDATLTFIAPFIYQLEGVSIISTAGKLNIDYEASDRVWFGRGWLGAESTIITNGGNVTFHGTHFVGVNGTINAGYGQVLIRSENPTGNPFDPDQGIYLFGNTTITGSKITLNSPILSIDPSVRQIIRTPPQNQINPPPSNGSNPAVNGLTAQLNSLLAAGQLTPSAIDALESLASIGKISLDNVTISDGYIFPKWMVSAVSGAPTIAEQQCAVLVQALTSAPRNTGYWMPVGQTSSNPQGETLQSGNAQPGQPIATFRTDGYYPIKDQVMDTPPHDTIHYEPHSGIFLNYIYDQGKIVGFAMLAQSQGVHAKIETRLFASENYSYSAISTLPSSTPNLYQTPTQ